MGGGGGAMKDRRSETVTGNSNSKTVIYRDGQSDGPRERERRTVSQRPRERQSETDTQRPRERQSETERERQSETDSQRPRGRSEDADAIVHLARLHSSSVSVFRLAVRGWSVRGIGRVGNWIVVHVLSCGGKVCEPVRACVRACARARVCVCACARARAGVLTST